MRRKTVGYMVLGADDEPRWLGGDSHLYCGGSSTNPAGTLFSTRKAAKRAIARTNKYRFAARAYGFQGEWNCDGWRIVRLVAEQVRKGSSK